MLRNLISKFREIYRRVFADKPSAPAPKPRRKRRNNEGAQFYFREDILDRLPRLHEHLSRLKHADKDAYAFHSKYGARISSAGLNILDFDPSDTPAAGMVFCGQKGDEEKDFVGVSFVYFREYAQKHRCIPNNGRVFAVYASYDVDRKFTAVAEFFVSVQGGEISLCKTQINSTKSIKTSRLPGKRQKKYAAYASIPQVKWGISRELASIAHDNDKTPQEIARLIFMMGASGWTSATDEGFVIRCNDGKTTATFNIDTKRTPYFFKDRITALAADGKRKRIFHSVRAHRRDMGDGEEVDVKAHYRGERHFTWGGDQVSITVPGLHYAKDWANFTAKAHDVDEIEDKTGFLNAGQVGKKLAEHLAR